MRAFIKSLHLHFIEWLALNSNTNILLEILSMNNFLDYSKCDLAFFLNANIHIKTLIWIIYPGLIIRINSNEHTSEFFFYCFLSSCFMVIVYIIRLFSSTSITSLCSGKCKWTQKLKTECYSNIFLLANIFIILVNTKCSLVIIISCWLNPNLDLNSFVSAILQYIIIFKVSFSIM